MVKGWECTRCGGAVSSYRLHKLVYVEEWDLTAMVGYWPLLDAVMITFRGTDSHNLGNWIADIDIRMIDYPVVLPQPDRPSGTALHAYDPTVTNINPRCQPGMSTPDFNAEAAYLSLEEQVRLKSRPPGSHRQM